MNNNRSSNQRRRHKRRKVPAATVALYIGMVVVILGICAAVFFISFNALNNGDDSSDSGSSSGFILPNDENVSSSASSGSTSGSSSSTGEQSSVPSSSSTPQSSFIDVDESHTDLGNDPLPMKFDKAFFKDDLFIGDSLFTGLYLYNHLDPENVAAKVGYTPYGAVNSSFDKKGLTAVEYAKQRAPKRIFILLGSNAMSSTAEMDALKNSYSNLLTTLNSELPGTKICCISITPVARVTDYPNVKNSNVRAMNEYIQQQCKALRFDYYDFYSVISDDEGYLTTKYGEADGMHFKGSTYKVLLAALQKKYS